MAKVPNNEVKQKQLRQRQKHLNELLYDDTTMFLITPLQVLLISLVFIANVFLLHIVSKFVPSNILPQASLSILVVLISIFFAVKISK
ncbi:Sec61beta [Nosema bombycis CQ1]|uniref:Sec61beta n=1 Tax=Nosema bombycis (strain CQ1 / CVCC 102059) TaxID=578461 RepID=R0MFZ2_NOSB1|nr:Sec61beta [Nosema bombycis CQ1]|eukprot:EOB11683.1 Sec61beta [Nosema bombycis CQ1]